MQLNTYIDHTLLKSNTTPNAILQLCNEAKTLQFYSVCINSCYVKVAKKALQNSNIKICTVIGFPLGATATKVKVFEAKYAVDNGADEVDMVMNIGWLKQKDYQMVVNDIAEVKQVIGKRILKVIIEISELTTDEIIKACQLCIKANADFIKTSTGFSKSGATLEAIKLIKETVGNKTNIKASGGIKDAKTAMQYIEAGANRIGASAGVKMMNEYSSK